MTKRERNLGFGFLAVLVVGLAWQFLLPSLGKVFSGDEELAKKQKQRTELESKLSNLENRLSDVYTQFVARTGMGKAVDTGDLKSRIYEEVTQHASASQLLEVRITPGGPSEDRKTKLQTLSFKITAKGSLRNTMDFIRHLYEMPYISRIESMRIKPESTGPSRDLTKNQVSLSGEVEVIVLPELPLPVPDQEQPEKVVRYKTDNFNKLYAANWFTPYVEPSRATPTPSPEPADTQVVTRPTPSPTPRPVTEPMDPDGDQKFVRLAMIYGSDDFMVREVLIEDKARNDTEYVAEGEELDGGEIVLVHPSGAIVHKQTEDRDFGYFVYPSGMALSDRVPLVDAMEWPEIQVAWFLRQARKQAEQEAAARNNPPMADAAPASSTEVEGWRNWLTPSGAGDSVLQPEDGYGAGTTLIGIKAPTVDSNSAAAVGTVEPSPAPRNRRERSGVEEGGRTRPRTRIGVRVPDRGSAEARDIEAEAAARAEAGEAAEEADEAEEDNGYEIMPGFDSVLEAGQQKTGEDND